MKLSFRLVNVFVRDGVRWSGNPLCVFPYAPGLSDAEMQAIALQFNLSETTFVTAAGDRPAVRIFTPTEELPFAGHPTLGTAHVLAAVTGHAPVALALKAGRVPVSNDGNVWTLMAPPASHRAVAAPVEAVAAALSLHRDDLFEPIWASTGTEQLLVPVRTPDAVGRSAPVATLLDRIRSAQGRSMVGVFHDEGETIRLRFFFAIGAAYGEDPATGSAAANLGVWLQATGRAPARRTILQGDRVGRPSTLHLDVAAGGAIRVSGALVEVGRGELEC